ncbi:lysophospholipid acyltransferase family protein [Luteococcus sp. Sow4_B9]|uniref:lysophospholipid acyltransferase family protein n=1 Tax=Luteococcus sp. Sow4_B9 TaxID=3438792 RepID=UPI003F99EAE7
MSDQQDEAGGALDRARALMGGAAEQLTVHVEGEERIPAEGPVILALNHLSHLDHVPGRPAGRRVRTVTAAPPATETALGLLRRVVVRKASTDEVDPVEAALGRALALLEAGEVVAIFPEGGRSPDGRLYRGETFIARAALASGAPVIPVAVSSEQSLVQRTVAPNLLVGEPVDLERFRGVEEDERVLRSVTDEVMYALMELSGQVYMDIPVAERRVQLAEQRRTDSTAARAEARARKARQVAAQQQRIADREAEAAELARAQAIAAEAAREHARRAAEADARRKVVRATRLPSAEPRDPVDLRAEKVHRPTGDGSGQESRPTGDGSGQESRPTGDGSGQESRPTGDGSGPTSRS